MYEDIEKRGIRMTVITFDPFFVYSFGHLIVCNLDYILTTDNGPK